MLSAIGDRRAAVRLVVLPTVVPLLYTIGHSSRSLDQLVALLAAHGIRHVVDVRRQPASRRHPHFHRRALTAGLAAAGVGYTWLEALGGLRTPAPASPHSALDDAMAGYAEHMATAAFAAAIERLAGLAVAPTAVMCAEADPASCHRRLLADWLVLHGWDVRHVRSPDSPPTAHTVTASARLAAGVVVYDRGQRSLF
jgi:uncharacterized protein (DUF488 family)